MEQAQSELDHRAIDVSCLFDARALLLLAGRRCVGLRCRLLRLLLLCQPGGRPNPLSLAPTATPLPHPHALHPNPHRNPSPELTLTLCSLP
eukprot:2417441-Prymnesium_polylepis.1